MHKIPKRGENRLWTLEQRLKISRAEIEGLDKSKTKQQIEYRLLHEDRKKLEEVLEIRRLWLSGISCRKLNRMFGKQCSDIIYARSYPQEEGKYDPYKRAKKR